MNRFKMGTRSCMLMTLVIILLLRTGAAAAASLNSGSWSIISSWSVGGGSSLEAVAAISANDVWAVGWEGSSDSFTTDTLTEHWDGLTWNLVPSVNVKALDQKLYGVAAASTNDVWAVGEYDNANGSHFQTLIEHWNGTSWSIVKAPKGNNYLNAVAAVSSNDVWAVGVSPNPKNSNSKTLTEHWNGTSWSIVSSPNVANINTLDAVAVISSNDIWAVGDYSDNSTGPSQNLVEHWNGTSWSIVSSPNAGPGDNALYAVTATSTNNVWAVGYSCRVKSCFFSGTEQTLTEQWNGSSWSIVSSPNAGNSSNVLTAVTASSANDIWATGYTCSKDNCFNSGIIQTLTEQWNGTNWSAVSSPNFGNNSNYLLSVASVPGSTQVWTTGTYVDGEGDPHPLTEFYCC